MTRPGFILVIIHWMGEVEQDTSLAFQAGGMRPCFINERIRSQSTKIGNWHFHGTTGLSVLWATTTTTTTKKEDWKKESQWFMHLKYYRKRKMWIIVYVYILESRLSACMSATSWDIIAKFATMVPEKEVEMADDVWTPSAILNQDSRPTHHPGIALSTFLE